MRVIQICPYSWDAHGGVQAHVRHLADELRGRGHDVLVLAPGNEPPAEAYVRLVGRPTRIRFNGSVAPLCIDPFSAAVVRDAFDDFAPDVIHVHEPFAPSTSLLGVLCADAPVVATFHAYYEPFTVHGGIYTAFSQLLRPVWSRIAFRIAVSRAAQRTMNARMRGAHSAIIPNGATIDHFGTAEPATLPAGRRMLFVGRLEPRKGFRVAVDAFAELGERYDDLRLVVVGDGPQRAQIRRLPRGLRERVDMMGRVSHDAMPTYHAASDVFVAPATGRESFGIILVEAMAAGLPVVASDLPGYREVVRHEREGLLVPPADPAALAEATARLLDDAALAKRLAVGGRMRARAFAWPRIAARVERVYDKVVRSRNLVVPRVVRRVGAA
ncbi:MAG TPA: glycosyltransferase family 4 protein [Gemmatimonadaceae bacterium]|nr:glycosyltransferase family 4 protein [Gemmatimonadaceae bacterium]